MRLDETVAEQMKPQIDIVGIDRCGAERGDMGANGNDLDIAPLIPAQASGDLAAQRRDGILFGQPFGAAGPGQLSRAADRGNHEIEDPSVGSDRCESFGDGALISGHDRLLHMI